MGYVSAHAQIQVSIHLCRGGSPDVHGGRRDRVRRTTPLAWRDHLSPVRIHRCCTPRRPCRPLPLPRLRAEVLDPNRHAMECSRLPVATWLRALWLIMSSSKGISSLRLADMLGIQQRSAWFMAHCVRELGPTTTFRELSVMSATFLPKTSATTSSKPQDMKPIERNTLQTMESLINDVSTTDLAA